MKIVDRQNPFLRYTRMNGLVDDVSLVVSGAEGLALMVARATLKRGTCILSHHELTRNTHVR
ncbi:MAG: hypothetical protein RJS97_02215 [Parvibaculaceae bacterium]